MVPLEMGLSGFNFPLNQPIDYSSQARGSPTYVPNALQNDTVIYSSRILWDPTCSMVLAVYVST